MTSEKWEVCEVWHDGKHRMRLSVLKHSNIRYTYCAKCGYAVLFERVLEKKPKTPIK